MTDSQKAKVMPVPAPRRNAASRANTVTGAELRNKFAENQIYFSVDSCVLGHEQNIENPIRPRVSQSVLIEFDPLAQPSASQPLIVNSLLQYEEDPWYDVPCTFAPPLPVQRRDVVLPITPQCRPMAPKIVTPKHVAPLSSSGSSVYDSALESLSDNNILSADSCFDNILYLNGNEICDSVFNADVPSEDVLPDLPPRYNLNTVVPPLGGGTVPVPPIPPRKPQHHSSVTSELSNACVTYDEVANDVHCPERSVVNIPTPDLSTTVRPDSRRSNQYEDWPQNDSSKCSAAAEEKATTVSYLKTSKEGCLLKMGKNKKDWARCWCVLSLDSFGIHTSKDSKPVDSFSPKTVLTIEHKDQTFNNMTGLFCFDVIIQGVKCDQSQVFTFGTNTMLVKHEWISCLWQCVTLSAKISDQMLLAVKKAGRFECKEAVSGIWQPVWLALTDRKLILWDVDDANETIVDLRKVRTIGHHKMDPSTQHTSKGGDRTVFHVTCPGKTIYLRSYASSETDDMYNQAVIARQSMGSQIEEQFLTQDDVPVLVDRCTNHIFVNGLQEEGIYRIAAKSSTVSSLLELLRQDPFNVNLSQELYSIHDVSNTLKRFFLQLPDSLLTNDLASDWQAAYSAEESDKANIVKMLLSRLPRVNYQTLKCLLTHLRCVIHCHEKNAMTGKNIAAVFGPTLLGDSISVGLESAHDRHSIGIKLVLFFLQNFVTLFDVSEKDLLREEQMLELVQRPLHIIRNICRQNKLSDNGILISVYVNSKDWGDCIPFTVMPKMTAKDLVMEVMKNRAGKSETVMLWEMVCNGDLERFVHHSEIVLDIVLRWMQWEDEDRKATHLLIKGNALYSKLLPLPPCAMSASCEVRLADAKTKSFKKALLEFKNAQLSYFKDNKLSLPVGCWNIEDLAWYVGIESRRNGPTRFALTFIEKSVPVKRTKSSPYFGTTVCMNSEEELEKWMVAMLRGEHPHGLFPQ